MTPFSDFCSLRMNLQISSETNALKENIIRCVTSFLNVCLRQQLLFELSFGVAIFLICILKLEYLCLALRLSAWFYC